MADPVTDQQSHQHQAQQGSGAATTAKPAPAKPGPGLAAVEAVRGTNEQAATQIAELMTAHPTERDAIMTWLHQHRGNEFVTQVLAHDAKQGAAAPKLPEGIEVKKVTATITIPAHRTLEGDWRQKISTREATQVTVEISATGVKVSFSPSLFVDATWPLQNATLYGAGLAFATGKASCDIEDGHGLGSGMISIKDKIAATITGGLEKGIAGTPLAKPGYDPTHDPDLASTLSSITTHLSTAFPAGDGAAPVATKEMSDVSASATVTTKGASFVKDGTGLQLGAGSELTLAAYGGGTVADLAGQKDAGGAARAAAIKRLSLEAADLTVVSKGAPIVKIWALSLGTGGAITIDRMTLLGKAADAEVAESGLSAIVALIGLAARDPDVVNGAAQNAADPKIVPGITKSMIEKQFTETVHGLVLEHRNDLPGMDLAAILKMS